MTVMERQVDLATLLLEPCQLLNALEGVN